MLPFSVSLFIKLLSSSCTLCELFLGDSVLNYTWQFPFLVNNRVLFVFQLLPPLLSLCNQAVYTKKCNFCCCTRDSHIWAYRNSQKTYCIKTQNCKVSFPTSIKLWRKRRLWAEVTGLSSSCLVPNAIISSALSVLVEISSLMSKYVLTSFSQSKENCRPEKAEKGYL